MCHMFIITAGEEFSLPEDDEKLFSTTWLVSQLNQDEIIQLCDQDL